MRIIIGECFCWYWKRFWATKLRPNTGSPQRIQ